MDPDMVMLRVAHVRVGLIPSPDDASLRGMLTDLADPVAAAPPDVTVRAASAGRLDDTLAAITQAVIAHSPALLLHGGVVVRRGVAILIPGESGIGKSTITAACLARGFDYVTDEMAAVDLTDGTVTGMTRPLMLTPWSVTAVGLRPDDAAGRKQAVLPERFGASVVREPVRVRHIVLPLRGAQVPSVRPAEAGEGVAAVLAAAFNHYRFGAGAWECAAELVRSAAVWHLAMADPASAADELAALADCDTEPTVGPS